MESAKHSDGNQLVAFHKCMFEDLDLKESLLRGIYALGFAKPSPFQLEVMLPILNGKNVIVQAQSGMRTLLAISALQILNIKLRLFHILMIVPTQERACGLLKVISELGDYMPISTCLCDKDLDFSLQQLKSGAQLVLATPDVITDLMEMKNLSLETLKFLLLDKTDQLLASFSEQVNSILKNIPNETQIGVFFNKPTKEFVESVEAFVKEPVKIFVEEEIEQDE